MKGRIVLGLFALPFLGVAVWAGHSIGTTLADAWGMRAWQPVEAELVDAGYSSHSGDDSTTYEAYATYRYRVGGRPYSGSRVGISSGKDNIGGYQRETGQRLAAARAAGRSIRVWYDPAAPGDSVIDRQPRWGLVGFKSVFLLAFGGFGAGALYLALRGPRRKEIEDDPRIADRPWLANEDWQTPEIRSSSKQAMMAAWLFAGFWNLISAPLPFLLAGEVLDKQNYAALIGLVFPLVGAGLLVWAVRRTREWRRFGAAVLELDPFPGAIGGHVGGRIDVALPYDAGHRFDITLTCVRSYASGSGKNRRRREKAEWQDDQQAHAEPGPAGTRLAFRFDVPAGLAPADARTDGDSRHLWRLNVAVELPGADFDRDYELPVYPTAARSTTLPERRLEEARRRQDSRDEADVRELFDLDYVGGVPRVRFPAGRNAGSALVGILFGGVFAAAGWFLLTRESELLIGSAFVGVGSLIALGMLYVVLNSLTVTREGAHLVSVRRILGLPVSRRSLRSDRIVRLSKDSSFQTASGSKHVMRYSVHAHSSNGERLTLGEGFLGESDANAAMRLFVETFGLRLEAAGTAPRPDPSEEIDVLAADR